ncbi:MAG: phosphotransferase [Chitinivibrionales bacterium]|nr:phosphotransferase [Chitinivibrionales bacterium]
MNSMLIELHCHTRKHSGCSRIDPVALIYRLKDKNIQGVVITEHHYLWKPQELHELREQTDLEPYFLLFSAQEVSTDFGHVLIFGARESIHQRTTVADLRARYPEAALVWAHPWRGGAHPSDERLSSRLLDGIEVFSSNHNVRENCRALTDWHRIKFTATSGSDAHDESVVGILPTFFDHPVESIEEIAEEIRHNRCRPYFKETIRSGRDTSVTKVTIGPKGEDERRYRLVLRKTADEKHFNGFLHRVQVMQTIHENGFDRGPYRIPAILKIDKREYLIIEEGMRGKCMYSMLSASSRESGAQVYRLAARWAASLHKKRLHVAGAGLSMNIEHARFDSYIDNARRTFSPFQKQIADLIAYVKEAEDMLFVGSPDRFVQCHGDYQPHNILVGQDKSRDFSTLYVAAIDFGSSYEFPPSFDIGFFLAHFSYQFRNRPDILEWYTDEEFKNEYYDEYGGIPCESFKLEIDLFRIRANLSIIDLLIHLGKGKSDELRVLVENSISLQKNGMLLNV